MLELLDEQPRIETSKPENDQQKVMSWEIGSGSTEGLSIASKGFQAEVARHLGGDTAFDLRVIIEELAANEAFDGSGEKRHKTDGDWIGGGDKTLSVKLVLDWEQKREGAALEAIIEADGTCAPLTIFEKNLALESTHAEPVEADHRHFNARYNTTKNTVATHFIFRQKTTPPNLELVSLDDMVPGGHGFELVNGLLADRRLELIIYSDKALDSVPEGKIHHHLIVHGGQQDQVKIAA